MAKLFYVIGASGAGKDSLLKYARKHISQSSPVVFAHRYITRPADAGGENHVALNMNEFLSRKQMGCFAMQWFRHNNWYGIGLEINQWLALGLNVVINGSRDYLDQALEKYPKLIPVSIWAEESLLRSRLIARGRENLEEIEARLKAARELDQHVPHPRLIKIDNNKTLEEAGSRLIKLLGGEKITECI